MRQSGTCVADVLYAVSEACFLWKLLEVLPKLFGVREKKNLGLRIGPELYRINLSSGGELSILPGCGKAVFQISSIWSVPPNPRGTAWPRFPTSKANIFKTSLLAWWAPHGPRHGKQHTKMAPWNKSSKYGVWEGQFGCVEAMLQIIWWAPYGPRCNWNSHHQKIPSVCQESLSRLKKVEQRNFYLTTSFH